MNLMYRREGFPEEGELVLCRVTNITPHSTFVNLEEYDKQGLIHISEISPGRIRNIYEFVKEGKIIVCKVLRVNKEKGYIDLSLRRVTQIQKRSKLDEIKEEQNSEKIIALLAKKKNIDFKQFYHEIADKILKNYNYVFECFDDVVNNKVKLEDFGIKKELADELKEIILARRKPKRVEIKGLLKLTSYEPNGVEVVKDALRRGISKVKNISIKYAGSGGYLVVLSGENFKEIEKDLEIFLAEVQNFMKEKKGFFSFERKEV
ncbi:MAG: translation initiation factor IF-2 subunit alpha [Candidatus Woesearchaeota archaeon]